MQVYLKSDSKFENLGITEMKSQNKYGLMYQLKTKLDLVTTEYVGDYYVFTSQNNKTFLVINRGSQMGFALKSIETALTKEKGFTFKADKEKVYIRIHDDLSSNIPKNQNLKISVNVYGVFVQNGSNTAFLQFSLSGYKVYPRVDFDNAVPV